MIRTRSRWLAAVLFMQLMFTGLALAPSASAAPTEFDEAAFAAAQADNRTILIETYAAWCLPCKLQAPIIARLLTRKPYGRVMVMRVGANTPAAVWQKLRLSGYGTLVVFKGKREIARGNPTNEAGVTALVRQAL